MASKKIYTIVAVAGILTASSVAWWYQNANKSSMGITVPGGPGGPGGAGGRAVGVELVNVKKMLLRDDAEAVGTLRSRQNVMMRPEVAGRILALGFGDGARVNVGQVLVQLDDTLQRAEVQQSLAQLSIARANYKRNQDLVAQNFVAQRVLEESAASLQVSEAQVSLSCARLERMRIVAPFSGVVGIRNINVGDFVKDGADLINLEDIGMLYVDYRLPERYQAKLAPGQVVELKIDALPGRLFKAKVEALDPLIEPNGRSIGMRAVLANGPGEPIAPPGGKKPDGSPAGGLGKPVSAGPSAAAASAPTQPASKPPQTANPAKVADGKSNKPSNNPNAGNGPVSGTFNLPTPQSLGCPPANLTACALQFLALTPQVLCVLACLRVSLQCLQSSQTHWWFLKKPSFLKAVSSLSSEPFRLLRCLHSLPALLPAHQKFLLVLSTYLDALKSNLASAVADRLKLQRA
jgi:multidrug efflux pump subunit AcrA (membrane-fusion protein)